MRFDGVRWSRLSPASFVVPEPAVDAAEPAIRVVTPAEPAIRVVTPAESAIRVVTPAEPAIRVVTPAGAHRACRRGRRPRCQRR